MEQGHLGATERDVAPPLREMALLELSQPGQGKTVQDRTPSKSPTT